MNVCASQATATTMKMNCVQSGDVLCTDLVGVAL